MTNTPRGEQDNWVEDQIFCGECIRMKKELHDVAHALARVVCSPTKPLGPQVEEKIRELIELRIEVDRLDSIIREQQQ